MLAEHGEAINNQQKAVIVSERVLGKCYFFADLLHLIENVFTLTPALTLTLTLKRKVMFSA